VVRGGSAAAVIPFSVSPESLTLGKDAGKGELKLAGEDGYGLKITETLMFQSGSYVVEHVITVLNQHSVPQSAELRMSWVAPVEWPKNEEQKFNGQHPVRTVRLLNGSANREVLDKIVNYRGPGRWVGLESEWYLTALIPMGASFQVFEDKRPAANGAAGNPGQLAEVGVVASVPTLQPGQTWEARVLTYLGPKEYSTLKAVGFDLDKSIYFGGFPVPQNYGGLPMEWLAIPVLGLMNAFYTYTHNYGVAIILLTV